MTPPKNSEWTDYMPRSLQRMIDDSHESFLTHFNYNISLLTLELQVLEDSKVGRYSPSKFRVTLTHGHAKKVEMELIDLFDDNQSSFIDFLAYRDGFMWPLGSVLKLEKLQIAEDTQDEATALTHLAVSLAMSLDYCVVVEEQKMLRQSEAVQEIWKDSYGFRSEKEIEYQGVRYWRFDHPARMMY